MTVSDASKCLDVIPSLRRSKRLRLEYPVSLTSCPCCGGNFVRVSQNQHFRHCNKKIKDDILTALESIGIYARLNGRLDEPELFFRDLKCYPDFMRDIRVAVQHYKGLTCFLGNINYLISRVDLEKEKKTKSPVRFITYTDLMEGLNKDLDAAVRGTANAGLNAKYPRADYILH